MILKLLIFITFQGLLLEENYMQFYSKQILKDICSFKFWTKNMALIKPRYSRKDFEEQGHIKLHPKLILYIFCIYLQMHLYHRKCINFMNVIFNSLRKFSVLITFKRQLNKLW